MKMEIKSLMCVQQGFKIREYREWRRGNILQAIVVKFPKLVKVMSTYFQGAHQSPHKKKENHHSKASEHKTRFTK